MTKERDDAATKYKKLEDSAKIRLTKERDDSAMKCKKLDESTGIQFKQLEEKR